LSVPAARATIGIIGGSGLYAMEELSEIQEVRLLTPFGEPSGPYVVGRMAGGAGRGPVSVAFLARHGPGHRLSPSEVNYRANLYGFKLLGVERVLSASAVGSLKEEIAPLDIVLPDQIVDRTLQRPHTFFGDGIVAHVSMADPFCPELRAALLVSVPGLGAKVHGGGAYLCIEGPQFSTRAESRIYRSWGLSVIGMTNATEARLAREAELCYATIALVTDYDVWHEEEEPVTVEIVIERLSTNARVARSMIRRAVAELPADRACACGRALENAIITDPASIPAEARERLRPIAGRYLPEAR
jgi:5'-methylthioadenosine phosphorylase